MSKILIKFENDSCITCDIAITSQDKQIGLSKVENLPANHGLLFAYETPESPLFWNRGVPFPIEILYIDANLTIAQINYLEENSSDIVFCKTPAKYIVELERGTCENLSLKVGTKIKEAEKID